MKIHSVTIQNYRGYQEPRTIIFDDLTLIVGKNDIGKSTVLEALDVFFGNRKADKSDLNINCDKESDRISITVEFSDLPATINLDEGAKTELGSEFLLNKDGYLKIKKVINPNSQAQPKVFIVANYPVGQENLLVLKNTDLKKLATTLGVEKDTYSASVNNSIRKAIWSSRAFALEERELDIDKEDGKEIYTKLEQEMPLYSLFSADRKNSDQDSEIQDPIKSSIKQIVRELGGSLDPIKQQILEKLNEVVNGTIEKLREMNPEVAKALKPVTDNPAWEKAFSVTIESDGVPLNKRGSGVKRLVLINFFRHEAERIKSEKHKVSIVYAIEEPETSQHPDWQIKLFDALNELAESGNIQIILTSHHPELSGLVKLENIRLIRKEQETIKIETGSDINYKTIAKTLGVLPRIDGAQVIVGLEGPNDIRFFKNIAVLFDLDPDDDRVLWIPLGGKTLRDYVNEKYLEKLELYQVHFYDRDRSGQYQDSVDKLVSEGNWAKLSNMLSLENYFHPSLYKRIWPDLSGDFVDCSTDDWLNDWKDKNIPESLFSFIKAEFDLGNGKLRDYSVEAIKRSMASHAHLMQIEMFKMMGALEEIESLFNAIKKKLK